MFGVRKLEFLRCNPVLTAWWWANTIHKWDNTWTVPE